MAFGAPVIVKADDEPGDASDDEPHQPEIYSDLRPYWRAWTAVENQREGCGPIRTEAVASYLDIAGVVEPAERVAYLDIIQELDVEARQIIAAEMERARSQERAKARLR